MNGDPSIVGSASYFECNIQAPPSAAMFTFTWKTSSADMSTYNTTNNTAIIYFSDFNQTIRNKISTDGVSFIYRCNELIYGQHY